MGVNLNTTTAAAFPAAGQHRFGPPGMGGPGGHRPDPTQFASMLIQRLDGDGDGAISAQEAATHSRFADKFTAADTDGDGSVTSTELVAHIEARHQAHAGARARGEQPADAAGGGTAAGQAEAGARHMRGTPPDPSAIVQMILQRQDTDGNGGIDLASEAGRMPDRIRQADADGDGIVSAQELLADIQAFVAEHPRPGADGGAAPQV